METFVLDTNMLADTLDHILRYLHWMPLENFQLNLIKLNQVVHLLVLVSQTYGFSIFFKTAKLQKFLIFK